MDKGQGDYVEKLEKGKVYACVAKFVIKDDTRPYFIVDFYIRNIFMYKTDRGQLMFLTNYL